MKKIILILATVSFSLSAFADINKEVLKMLMKEADAITLVDSEGSTLSADYQLPELFVSYLSSYPKLTDGMAILKDVSVECENKTKKGLTGVSTFSCHIIFLDGDFSVENGKIDLGSGAESSISVRFEVTKAVIPTANPILKSKKLKAIRAG